MKESKSHQLLSSSIERRLKHLMVQLLTKFENNFTDIKESQTGTLFRSDIKTAVNDVMRATRDELRDYSVEYRPLRLVDNILSLTVNFIETVKKVEFTDKPGIKIWASSNKANVLEAIREEIGAGVLYYQGESTILEIIGQEECINKIIPIMDKYNFAGDVRIKYLAWREELVNRYINRR